VRITTGGAAAPFADHGAGLRAALASSIKQPGDLRAATLLHVAHSARGLAALA